MKNERTTQPSHRPVLWIEPCRLKMLGVMLGVRQIINNSSFTLDTSLIWGLDLSGSMQAAGGVGGLLQVTDHSSLLTHHFPIYDGNGNITEYLDSTGAIAAHYEYDPFGSTTVATGPKANDFSYRFSTKPIDTATGLYYYGYRFYDPSIGRWLNRDPIEESGGMNVYWFVNNDSVNYIDSFGMEVWTKEDKAYRDAIIAESRLTEKPTNSKLRWEKKKSTFNAIHAGNDEWHILCIAEEGAGDFWPDLKKSIEDNTFRYLTRSDFDGNQWTDNAGGESTEDHRRVIVSPEVQVTNWVAPNGWTPAMVNGFRETGVVEWVEKPVDFKIALWHELIGHATKGLNHPKEEDNSFITVNFGKYQKIQDMVKNRKKVVDNQLYSWVESVRYNNTPDPVVVYENSFREAIGKPMRRPQYYDLYASDKNKYGSFKDMNISQNTIPIEYLQGLASKKK